jgi:segregation and condensation protein B
VRSGSQEDDDVAVAAEDRAGLGREVAEEIRGRLQALDWSVSELSRRSGVSREVVSGILNGRRLPSVSTYERLRQELGLLPSASRLTRPLPPQDVTEEHLSRLAACLVSARSALLTDLADATQVSVAAVREGLSKVQERITPCGLELVTDGQEVTLTARAHVRDALLRLGQIEQERELTDEALQVLTFVAWKGEASRAEVETARGCDCASLIRRLTHRGYLAALEPEKPSHAPCYRLTPRAVSALGYSSLDDIRMLLASVREEARVDDPPAAAIG